MVAQELTLAVRNLLRAKMWFTVIFPMFVLPCFRRSHCDRSLSQPIVSYNTPKTFKVLRGNSELKLAEEPNLKKNHECTIVD